MTEAKKVGVFICQCGGNISDFVDTEKLRDSAGKDPRVAVAQVHMFACSDAGQQCIVQAIREEHLDGIVVASCSPKLHLGTFRAAAMRAGLNPFQYTQANIREQVSWAHTHDRAGATAKAEAVVEAGIAHTALSKPLTKLRAETLPHVLVIGAGVAGLRSALALSEMGIAVTLVEKAEAPGGNVLRWEKLFPNDRGGPDIVRTLLRDLRGRENITLFTNAELVAKEGHLGDFTVRIRVGPAEEISQRVGAILVTTGFEPAPAPKGEFGEGLEGVITLPDFEDLLAASPGPLRYHGREVRTIAYVYCVGSRAPVGQEGGRTYCSRYCCSATSFAAIRAAGRDPRVRQFHLVRDVRTYGKYETLYDRALATGSVFLRYSEESPPAVTREDGHLTVRVKDLLTASEEVEISADLVVLVTGMAPRANAALNDVLKLPVGTDGFFHEIHLKLRPVETVVDGVFIAGAAQGPKTVAEAVASSLAASAKAAGLLLKGFVELEPLVAIVDSAKCTWCTECQSACPYGAIEEVVEGDRHVARVTPILCKGEGACVPVCPSEAVEVEGYTNAQLTAMIDALAEEE